MRQTQRTVKDLLDDATDSAGHQIQQTFTINVGEVNEGQAGLALAGNAVAENAAGAVIGALTVTDPDAGDSQSFEVSDARFEVVDGQLAIGGVSFGALYLDCEWLDAGEPPIAFTAGSAMVHAREFFAASIEACESLNRRGLVLTRFGDQLPRELPPSVKHVEYAPFGSLLPRCAALVHHGGIGTTAQALRGEK